jgi:hypothetical protein
MDYGDSLISILADTSKLDPLASRFDAIECQLEVRLAEDFQDNPRWLIRWRGNSSLYLVLLSGDEELVADTRAMSCPVSNWQRNFSPRKLASVGVLLRLEPPFDQEVRQLNRVGHDDSR